MPYFELIAAKHDRGPFDAEVVEAVLDRERPPRCVRPRRLPPSPRGTDPARTPPVDRAPARGPSSVPAVAAPSVPCRVRRSRDRDRARSDQSRQHGVLSPRLGGGRGGDGRAPPRARARARDRGRDDWLGPPGRARAPGTTRRSSPTPGRVDPVAVHWAWPALRLSSAQRSALERYSRRSLEQANEVLPGSAPVAWARSRGVGYVT